MFRIVSPVKMYIEGHDLVEVEKHLTYIDKTVDMAVKRMKDSPWLRQKLGPEGFELELQRLKATRKKNILFEDEKGHWTYTGMAKRLSYLLSEKDILSDVEYPAARTLAWDHEPEHSARGYQAAAVGAMLAAKHAAVSIATGLGKSHVIRQIVRELGLKTLILTPSLSIAKQIYSDFLRHFGKKNVGAYYGGKKEPEKLIVVGVAQSLTKVDKGEGDWHALSQTKVLIADESHLVAAGTLTKVCVDIAGEAPYRFFFSATQMRNDGKDIILEGLMGEVVHTMSVKEGVEQGYLARPKFHMIEVVSTERYMPLDINKKTRVHLYKNPSVNAAAAQIANNSYNLLGKQVLILIDEIEQFSLLLPHLKIGAKFAHGNNLSEKAKKTVPQEFHKVDTTFLVNEFNAGRIPCLVGTSCISLGTDVRSAEVLIYLQGGVSEIQFSQSVGRGTRGGANSKVFLPSGKIKTDCAVFDFDVVNVKDVHRHATTRAAIAEEMIGSVNRMRYSG